MAVGTTNYPASLDTVVELVEAANNAADQLSGNISDSATSLTLMDGSEFAQSGIVAIDNELLSYTSRSGNTLNGLVRGIEGTTAAAHTDMSAVRQVITAASHNVQSAAIIALETKLGTGTDIAWSKMAPLTTNRMLVSDSGGDVAVSPLTHDATNAIIGNVGGLDFDTTPTAGNAAARLIWDDAEGTAALTLKGGNVTVPLSQRDTARVVNKSGSNLLASNYQVVRISTAQGQRLGINLARANSEPNSTDILGLVSENISNNQEGFVTTRGLVTEIDTTGSLQGETWADGQILYLSPGTLGGLTKVEPQAPNHLVIVGYVVYAHQNHGKIFVAIQTSWETAELHDVKITGTPTAGSLLIRNATTGVWENATLTAGSNISITNADAGITIAATGSGDVVGPSSATDNALARFDTTTGKLIQNSLITLSDAGALSFPDGVRQTFNPNGTNAGINVGAHTSDPSSATNGDLWYNSTANQLKTRRGAVTEVVATIPSNLGDEIPILNATTGNLSATGEVFWDGSGNALQVGNTSTGTLRLVNATGTDSFTLRPPASGGVVALTLPPGIGSIGQALTSDGTGGTSWSTITAGVSSVSGTSPVVSSGGSTPAISLASGYGDTQNPYASKTANHVLVGPATGVAAAPTFRALVDGDIPDTLTVSKISNLTSNGFVKTSAGDGTLSVDTNTYLTGNQTITLSGDVSGSGTTAITTAIGASKVTNTMLAGSIAASKLVGTDIATVGTITSGTWNGTTIAVANGGTGQTSYTDGQLLIGNTATGGLSKATLTAGSGVTITNGNGSISIASAGGGGSNSVCDGRLSVSSTLAVPTSDITNATTLYYLPYTGNGIALYDGTSAWTVRTFSGSGISISLAGLTPNCTYDVFAYWTGSAVALELESWGINTAYNITTITRAAATVVNYSYTGGSAPFQTTGVMLCMQGLTGNVGSDVLHSTWSNTQVAGTASPASVTFDDLDTTGKTYTNNTGTIRENNNTRTTALVRQDGVFVKSGATTRRYLGTIRIDGAGGQTQDTDTQRLVWNYYNRVDRKLFRAATLNSWTVKRTSNYQFWPAEVDQRVRIQLVCGVEEDRIVADVTGCYQSGTAGQFVLGGVGFDRPDENSTWSKGRQYLTTINTANGIQPNYGTYESTMFGFHYLHWVVYASASSITAYGTDSSSYKLRQIGLGGMIRA